MWERYELKDEVTDKVKLVYELKRDIANDMVSKRYKCRFYDKSKDEWKEISGTYKKEEVKYRLEQEIWKDLSGKIYPSIYQTQKLNGSFLQLHAC